MILNHPVSEALLDYLEQSNGARRRVVKGMLGVRTQQRVVQAIAVSIHIAGRNEIRAG